MLSVSGVTMMGNVRVLPVFEHRMLLYSFKEPPRLDMKLGVKGPAIGKMEIPQFDFVKRAVKLAISVGVHDIQSFDGSKILCFFHPCVMYFLVFPAE